MQLKMKPTQEALPFTHLNKSYYSLSVRSPDTHARVISDELSVLQSDMSLAVNKTSEQKLLTIHGMEENWDVFESTLPYLDNTQSLRLDMPWSGQLGYDWALQDLPLAQRLRQAFQSMVNQPRIVMAHSFGSAALLSYLDEYGDSEFDGIILISPFYFSKERQFDWDQMDYYARHYTQFLENTVSVRVNKALDPDIKTRMAQHINHKIGPLGCVVSLHHLIRTRRIDLSRFSVPTLILTGSDDFYALPEHCQRMAEIFQHGQCEVIQDCGHFSMIDKPGEVGQKINHFINNTISKI